MQIPKQKGHPKVMDTHEAAEVQLSRLTSSFVPSVSSTVALTLTTTRQIVSPPVAHA
jgi:hypothetical protein